LFEIGLVKFEDDELDSAFGWVCRADKAISEIARLMLDGSEADGNDDNGSANPGTMTLSNFP
jgi:hypothetical protein